MFNINYFYGKMYKRIFNFIASKIGSKEIAEELTQDVFIRADKNKNEFNSQLSSEVTWLFNIAKNIVIDHYRRVKMETISIHSEMNGGEEDGYDGIDYKIVNEISDNRSPYVEMMRKDLNSKMIETFRKIPRKNKRVVNLYFNHQKKIVDIASMTGENINTIKTKIKLARELFKNNITI